MKSSTQKSETSPGILKAGVLKTGVLKGWRQIATFLGLPVSTAQRWAKSGMPIVREGRSVQASPEELNRWMGRETSEPVHIATESADLSAELRRGLSYARKRKQSESKKKRRRIRK